MTLLPSFFIDSVAAIGFANGKGTIDFSATGFLFGCLKRPVEDSREKSYTVSLVTNRHVFEGKESAEIRHNPDGTDVARAFHVDLIDDSGKQLWGAHPDPSVDVAALSVNFQWLRDEKMRVHFIQQDTHARTMAEYAAEGGAEGDGIFVLGFPLGDVGGDRNHVIVRGGVIARIGHVVAGAAQNFLVDANIFPGNSGGPVVCRPEGTAISGTKAVTSAYLIGMVAAYVPYEDVAVSQQTGRPRVIFQENSGLGSIVPVERIVETIEHAMKASAPAVATPSLA